MTDQPQPPTPPTPQPPKFYTKQDITQLLAQQGHDESTCFIDPQGYQLLIELAHNFVEQLLDTYRHKKKEISVNDVRKVVMGKFPGVYVGDMVESKVVVQGRVGGMEEVEEKVREVERKFGEG